MKSLLIIEDDIVYATSLKRAMTRRNYECELAHNLADAKSISQTLKPNYILVDLQLGQENSQDFVPVLRKICPQSSIVILTGNGSIPSAVSSIKSGADFYLSKPASPDEIEAAFAQKRPDTQAKDLWDLEQEHIHKVLAECGGNITQAAKTLGLHRRTLQRRLGKN